MRIQNPEQLVAEGNRNGRKDMVKILEAGLTATDPYQNTAKLLHLQGHMLTIGNPDFEADGDPQSGKTTIDLSVIHNIYVVGAGKGAARVAQAIEDALGDRLSGGEIICKYGDESLLQRIHVTFGAHPVPDENCVEGSGRIVALSRSVTENDLVFTLVANGGSSLLTLPYDDIPLEDARRVVQLMQIEKGISTMELNIIRNHIDQIKGGRISRLFSKAQMIHLVVTDVNHHVQQQPRADYKYLMENNVWLHNLPEGSTFTDAIEVLKRHQAWEECPASVKNFLLRGTEEQETVKYYEFSKMRFRVFGLMPDKLHFFESAKEAARQLGYHTATLSESVHFEAAQVGYFAGSIARAMVSSNDPLAKAPIALFTTGEMLVTIGQHHGVGGRNQEFATAAAMVIDGCPNVIIGSVDTDGTDGPGNLCLEGAPKCLAGAIVDGYTVSNARANSVDLNYALQEHNLSEALWKLNCGVYASQNISMADLTVILIQQTDNTIG